MGTRGVLNEVSIGLCFRYNQHTTCVFRSFQCPEVTVGCTSIIMSSETAGILILFITGAAHIFEFILLNHAYSA